MDISMLENYIERIYGYAVKNTFNREEADELSQEILFTVVRSFSKLQNADSFEPWLWGIAKNVTRSYKRNKGKERATYSFDVLDTVVYEEPDESDNEELYDFLRTKITMLSAIYRDIIILYYYDNLSTKQISERLGIPEGTVTWRLSEARRKLKKECDTMNETALRPKKMNIGIYGNGNYNGKTIPFPSVFIDDSLSQNILYYCYDDAMTVEELAKYCSVPAYYIEERVDNLLKREAIVEQSKGKYRTDFVIWSDKYGIYCEENAEKALMPVMDRMIAALDAIASDAGKIDFYKAEKSASDLWYLYGIMAFAHISRKYCKLPYPEFKEKYDGYAWCYLGNMETGKHHRVGIGTQHCANLGSRGGCSHTAYNSISGISFRHMMYDNYINVCVDILYDGKTEDVDSLANAIKDGYIVRREDGTLFITTPAFTTLQNKAFEEIADKHLSPLMPEYSDAVNKFVEGYKNLFPKHLHDDADRMCQGIFTGMFSVVVDYAQRTEKIAMPTKGSVLDVLIQFK